MKKIDKKIVAYSVVDAATQNAANVKAAEDARVNLPVAEIKVDQIVPSIPMQTVSLQPALQMHEGVERPTELSGRTYKIKSPLSEQSIYVTINDITLNEGTVHEQKRPYELFLSSKNLEAHQWMVALTRMISAVFRKGGDVTFIVRELKEVYDPRGGYIIAGGGIMPSIVAEIGVVVERHLSALGLLKREALSPEAQALINEKKALVGDAMKNANFCPKCNEKSYVIMDGCGTCLQCGYSKCS